MIAIGIASRKKAMQANGFFVANRGGSSLLITGSLLATIIGGSATVGMAGLGFKQGLTGSWWLLVGSIGLIILGRFFAKKVRGFGLYTLPELVGKQYDSRVAMIASVLIVVSWAGVVAGQIIAAGTLLSILGMGSISFWMVIFTAVFVTYTAIGGQYSVIRTDTIQSIIIFGGIFAALVFLIQHVGGIDGLRSSLPAEYFSFPLSSQFGLKDLVTFLIIVGSTYVVGPDMYSRLFCAKDEKTAQRATYWTASLIIPFAFAIILIGMGASVLYPQILPEQAFPLVIKDMLPPFAGGIVLAALLCAVMSSADTCLLSASTILVVDIAGRLSPSLSEKKILLFTRCGIVILGLCSLALALVLKGVITALLFAYTVYTCGLVVPVIAGFYRDKLKLSSLGVLVAIIGGGGIALCGKLFHVSYLDLGGFAASALLLFLISFIYQRRKNPMRNREKY